MAKRSRHKAFRSEPGAFVRLPWAVLDSAAYQGLSHPARSLLLEVARQYHGDDNGRMLLSTRHLAPRGWRSADVVFRAKHELLEAGLIYQTVMGQRPNKASWYAITWHSLDRHPAYDAGADAAFVRSAYKIVNGVKNASLYPSGGISNAPIAPPHGIEARAVAPSHGAIKALSAPSPIPPDGNPLALPSTERCLARWQDDGGASFRELPA